jgi:hypothetical protein
MQDSFKMDPNIQRDQEYFYQMHVHEAHLTGNAKALTSTRAPRR